MSHGHLTSHPWLIDAVARCLSKRDCINLSLASRQVQRLVAPRLYQTITLKSDWQVTAAARSLHRGGAGRHTRTLVLLQPALIGKLAIDRALLEQCPHLQRMEVWLEGRPGFAFPNGAAGNSALLPCPQLQLLVVRLPPSKSPTSAQHLSALSDSLNWLVHAFKPRLLQLLGDPLLVKLEMRNGRPYIQLTDRLRHLSALSSYLTSVSPSAPFSCGHASLPLYNFRCITNVVDEAAAKPFGRSFVAATTMTAVRRRMAAFGTYSWLGYLVAGFLDAPSDRLALALTSKDICPHALARLPERLLTGRSTDLTRLIQWLQQRKAGCRVRHLRIELEVGVIAMDWQQLRVLLEECSELEECELIAHEGLQEWPVLMDERVIEDLSKLAVKRSDGLSTIKRFAIQRVATLADGLSTPPNASPRTFIGHMTIVVADVACALQAYLRPQSLTVDRVRLSRIPIDPTMRYIEIRRQELFGIELGYMLAALQAGQILSLVDVRMSNEWQGPDAGLTMDNLPRKVWTDTACNLHLMEKTANSGGKLIVTCTCTSPRGQALHLPGGRDGHAVCGLHATMMHALAQRNISLEIRQPDSVDVDAL